VNCLSVCAFAQTSNVVYYHTGLLILKYCCQAWIQDSVVQDQDQDSDAQNQDQDQAQGQIKHDTAIAWHQYNINV